MPISYLMNHTRRRVHNFGFGRKTTIIALFPSRTPSRSKDIDSHRARSCPSMPAINGAHERPMTYSHPWGLSSFNIHTQLSSMQNDDDGASHSNINPSDLPAILKESYASGETDGVQAAFKSNNVISNLSANFDTEMVASYLIDAAIEAARKDRGVLAAMLNSILASCCGNEDDDAHPQISLAILTSVDKMHVLDESSMIAPDIVSLSLIYYALDQSSKSNGGAKIYEYPSHTILERAQRLAKKVAGSHRRKELNRERRRGINANEIDSNQVERNLQLLCGPDIRILHETTAVIVISKPAGMICYHSKRTGAGKITSSRKKNIRIANDNDFLDVSIVDALIDSSVSLSTLNPSARGIVHRLDRGTSGSLVLAKTDEIHLILTALFFLRKVEKKYLALVPGLSSHSNTINDGNVGCESMGQNTKSLSLGSTGVIDVPVDGRPARSSYTVVNQYGEDKHSSTPNALMLEVATLTGRKHQVRVHCASLGRPIFLDLLYSSSNAEMNSKAIEKGKKKRPSSPTLNSDNNKSELAKALDDVLLDNAKHQQERFFLHAASLAVKELGICVDAPLPRWWGDFTDRLEIVHQ